MTVYRFKLVKNNQGTLIPLTCTLFLLSVLGFPESNHLPYFYHFFVEQHP